MSQEPVSTPIPRERLLLGAALALLVVAALGIWWLLSQPDRAALAQDAGVAIAEDLTSHRVPDQAVDGPSNDELFEVVRGMGKIDHAVTLAAVEVSDDEESASVRLGHTWQVTPEKRWEYTTDAQLTWVDGAWRLPWRPDIVAPDLTEGERLRGRQLKAPRASIVGDGDVVLVKSRRVRRVGIDKTKVSSEQAVASARRLARSLGLDVDALAARTSNSGPRAFVEAIVYRIDAPELDTVAGLKIPGLLTIVDEMMLAPTATFAQPLLGRVGEATAEDIAGSGGSVTEGDVIGQGGLQQAFNKQLVGSVGFEVSATVGDTTRVVERVDPRAGEALRVSLNEDMQAAAEAVLAGVDSPSALVAIRPSTGELLAVASGKAGGQVPTATGELYPPGSIFKTVSALALMRAGVGPEDMVRCPTKVTVGGREFTNYAGYPESATGQVPLATAVAQSCNTAFAEPPVALSASALQEAAEGLGVTTEYDVGVSVARSVVGAPLDPAEAAAQRFGHADVRVSPLSAATLAASIAAGRPVAPRLVLRDGGSEPSDGEEQGAVTAGEAEALRSMMRRVVTEGTATLMADIPGDPVLAKTGTAEFGTEAPLRNHAWMIAISGDLALAVFVYDGESGPATAGPIAKNFISQVR